VTQTKVRVRKATGRMIAEGFDVASRHMGQTHHVQFVCFQECHHCSDLTFTDKTKNAFFSHGCTYHDRGRGTQRENALSSPVQYERVDVKFSAAARPHANKKKERKRDPHRKRKAQNEKELDGHDARTAFHCPPSSPLEPSGPRNQDMKSPLSLSFEVVCVLLCCFCFI